MYGFSRKHNKVLLIVFSAIVIASFVTFLTPSQLGLFSGGKADFGRLYGRPVRQSEVLEARTLSRLGARLRFGDAADTAEARERGYELGRDSYQRLFFAEKFKQYGITVTEDEVAGWIQQNLKDQKSGKVDYDGFLTKGVLAHGFTEAEFLQLIRYEIAFNHLVEVVSVGSDLVTPREAEAEFRRQNQQAIVSIASFSASNYLAGVTVDGAQIAQFFTNRLANYRIPERTVVSYVRWDASNHLAEATADIAKVPDLAAKLETLYADRGASAFRDPAGNVMTKEAALAYIKQQSIEGEAVQRTMADAKAFANELYAMEPVKPENLAQLAAKKGLSVRESAPFSEFGRSAEFEDAPTLTREAARLEADQPFTKPVAGGKAVYLAAVLRRLPSETPPLDTVRPRVTEDFRRARSQELARAAGEALASAVKAAGTNQSIGAVAAQSKVQLTPLPPFSLSTESLPELAGRISIALLKDTVFNLKPGSASRFVTSADGGFVAYLDRFKPVDDATLKSALNSFLDEERRARRGEVFNAWLSAEYKRSGLPEPSRGADRL